MQRLPLNVFQRLIRIWETAHPYNAAQAVKIEGRVAIETVEHAWDATLRDAGLGHVAFSGNALTHYPLNGTHPRYPIQLLPEGLSLDQYLSEEINRSFEEADHSPFRPFLLHEGTCSWLGLTYQHCVADSVSIRFLLKNWLDSILSRKCNPRALVHEPAGYWRLFAARSGATRLDESAMHAFRGFLRFRRVLKPQTVGTEDYPSRVLLKQAPEGLIARLSTTCRSRGWRVGDVMLAALADVARRHVPTQARPRRRDIGVGCVVDLRPHATDPAINKKFGLFLGFSSVICQPGELAEWGLLLKAVQRQTALNRKRGIASVSTAWMGAAVALRPLVPKSEIYHFFRKQMPLIAGLSSVNLRDAWPGAGSPELLDYVRVSPTGPMAPVVLSATTLQSRLTLALTYRPAIVPPCAAEALISQFVDRLWRVDNQP